MRIAISLIALLLLMAMPVGADPINSLIIPNIDIATEIISCPLNSTSWDTSEVWTRSCFLEGLSLPGDGNVVIAGHYDNTDGSPAVFYSLPNVEVGDQVFLFYNDRQYVYTIVNYRLVDYRDLTPLRPTDGHQLTLLTSAGRYSQRLGRYDSVFVVVAFPEG